MEGKTIGMLVAFAMIACFAGALSYYLEVESKRKDLADAKTLLANTTANLANKQSTLESTRSKMQALRDQIDNHTSLADAKQTLTTQLATLESEKADTQKLFVNAVMKVRTTSPGMEWPDVSMSNGSILTGVTIQRVTDTDVSLAHSGGVTKILAEDLPSDLKERFRYNMPPMIQPKDKGGAAAGVPAPPPVSPAGRTTSERDAQNQILIDKVAGYENQIASLEKIRRDWEAKAGQHRALGDSARSRGRPSSTDFANAAAADRQAGAVAQQINAIHNEVNTLRSKIR